MISTFWRSLPLLLYVLGNVQCQSALNPLLSSFNGQAHETRQLASQVKASATADDLNVGRFNIPTTPDDVCAPNPLNPSAVRVDAPPNCDEVKYLPVTEHSVVTNDGYILTLYQITASPYQTQSQPRRKPSVLIQHGFLSASDNWVLQPSGRNLAMILSDAGYDVYIGNYRGTTYSRGHVRYNETQLEYWDFSWHELGIHDLPATINYILKTSGNEQIFYCGHSMGTTTGFVALSEIPELNGKVAAAFMLAPAAYMGHLTNAVRLTVPFVYSYAAITNAALGGAVKTSEHLVNLMNISPSGLCGIGAAKCGLCNNVLHLAFGYNPDQLDIYNLPNIANKFPNTVSVKMLSHYAQTVSDCSFRKYDYGTIGNYALYGSPTPPMYKLQDITAPMYFFYSDNDNLIPPNDIFITARHFQPGVIRAMKKVEHSLFNHMDFQMGKDADKYVYNEILTIMNSISLSQ